MLRRRQINADPRGRIALLLLAAADAVRWPFERLAWTVERRVLWPLGERTAGRSLPAPRTAGAGALAAVVAAAVLVGVLWQQGGEAPREQVTAAPARVAIAPLPPPPQPAKPRGRQLQGAPPSFALGKGVGVASEKSDGSSDSSKTAAAPKVEPEAGDESSAVATAAKDSGAAATSSTAKPVPAGRVAMKVARRFSEAFVFYEIGKRPARAKTVFGETATPQLAEALSERTPRLPSSGKVPKARVLNLIPGPRRGKAYTVSASLLRVGLTSELRLEMKKKGGDWVVTDVRG